LLDEPAPIALDLVGLSASDSSVFLRRVDAEGSVELISVPFEPATGSEPTVHQIPMKEDDWGSANISADGRWLAYIATEAGRRELFVRKVLSDASVGPKILASSEVGDFVVWSKSIRAGHYELLFIRDEQHFLLDVFTEPSVQVSEPRKLNYDPFSLGIQWVDSLPGGRLLVVRAPDTEAGAPTLRLILNWTQALAQQVPVSGE